MLCLWLYLRFVLSVICCKGPGFRFENLGKESPSQNLGHQIPAMTSILGSVISSMVHRMPSRPSPESLMPP